MANKFIQHPDVLEKIKADITEAEDRRRQLRSNHNLAELETGNGLVLKSDEFLRDLVAFITSENDNNIEKKRCLVKVGEVAVSEETTLKERALLVFSLTTETLLKQGEHKIISILADCYCSWLENETEFLPGFIVLAKQIEKITEWLLLKNYWKETQKIVAVLSKIELGVLKKNHFIKGQIQKSLKNIAQKDTIEILADRYLRKDENQTVINGILISFGENAAVYLVNRIICTQSTTEQVGLAEIIPAYGDLVGPVFSDCLAKNQPLNAIRTIISIISEMKQDSLYEIIREYFQHSDTRVQHEMISCVVKLGGNEMSARFIDGLHVVDESLKIHIVRILAGQPGKDELILKALTELAQKWRSFSDQFRSELLKAIIIALKNFPCRASKELLEQLREECAGMVGGDAIKFQINETLQTIEPLLRHSIKRNKAAGNAIEFASDPALKQLALTKVRNIEAKVSKLVASGKLDLAGELICQEALTAAQDSDYITAEILRDRILEINPMALAEAVQLGDDIENMKNGDITSHHVEIWRELHDKLGIEQFNVLYSGFRQENYQKGETIVHAKETDGSLYFLNSGHVGISCISGGKEAFLKKMKPGTVIGGEQFFSASVWTVTLKAISNVQVNILDRLALEKIEKTFPGLEDVLSRFCKERETIPELVKMTGDDRRDAPRYGDALLTQNILLDQYGNRGKRSFNGELLDISKGGFSFSIKIPENTNTRLLLGREILTTISVEGADLPQCTGVIVGVRCYDDEQQTFSIHVKSSNKIEDSIIKRVETISRLRLGSKVDNSA